MTKKILAVASSGGHWVQLLRLDSILNLHETFYASTDVSVSTSVNGKYCTLRDANLTSKAGLFVLALQVLWVVIKTRPDIVISTGAAPGYFAVFWGRLFGAKTIWIDSIANVDQLSVAGQKAGRWANIWLTQWPHLAKPEGPHFKGAVL